MRSEDIVNGLQIAMHSPVHTLTHTHTHTHTHTQIATMAFMIHTYIHTYIHTHRFTCNYGYFYLKKKEFQKIIIINNYFMLVRLFACYL